MRNLAFVKFSPLADIEHRVELLRRHQSPEIFT